MKNFTQDGDRITFAASALVGPNSPIKSGDPVVVGRVCGVANADAVPTIPIFADGNVVVSLKGCYSLAVKSTHHNITTVRVKLFGATPGAVGADS
jgi:predicted RecA/RadA family phage recombinase